MKHNKPTRRQREALAIQGFGIYDHEFMFFANTTVCQLTYSLPGEEGVFRVSTGVAQTHPDDSYNPQIGALLAFSRALESVGSTASQRAIGLVTHADNMRTQSVNQRTKNKERAQKIAAFRAEGRAKRALQSLEMLEEVQAHFKPMKPVNASTVASDG